MCSHTAACSAFSPAMPRQVVAGGAGRAVQPGRAASVPVRQRAPAAQSRHQRLHQAHQHIFRAPRNPRRVGIIRRRNLTQHAFGGDERGGGRDGGAGVGRVVHVIEQGVDLRAGVAPISESVMILTSLPSAAPLTGGLDSGRGASFPAASGLLTCPLTCPPGGVRSTITVVAEARSWQELRRQSQARYAVEAGVRCSVAG